MEIEKDGSPESLGQGEGQSEGSRVPDRVGGDEGSGTQEVAAPAEAEGTARSEASASEGADPKELGISARSPLHIKITSYDGPLDLLLDLIKKNEMDIYNIQISEITHQYLQYLEEMRRLDLEIAGEFLVIAATLIYIKSRTLLPIEEGVEEEDGQDPREELVRKLLEYQAFKEAARSLGLLENERSRVFTRQISDYYLSDLEAEDPQIDTFSANLYDLLSAFQQVLTRKEKEHLHEVYEQVISIEEKMAEIKTFLTHQKKVVFSNLFSERSTRNELIATFLALLEIVRSKFAVVVQEEQFGEILIERNEAAMAPLEGEAK